MADDSRVDFTRGAAERIARAVRTVEQGDRSQSGPRYPRVWEGGGGGNPVRLGKTTAGWAIGTCATVTLWEQVVEGQCQPGQTSPVATIENVVNLSMDVPSGSWVEIGKGADGRWYLIEAGIEGSCRKTIGGEDITKWPGWNASIVQILGHDENGCLKWFDTESCAPSSSGE